MQKNQPELLGNHLLNHQRAVADQVDQAEDQVDLAADGRKVEPVELVADRDLAKNLLNRQKGFSTYAFCPYSFPTGKMRNSNE